MFAMSHAGTRQFQMTCIEDRLPSIQKTCVIATIIQVRVTESVRRSACTFPGKWLAQARFPQRTEDDQGSRSHRNPISHFGMRHAELLQIPLLDPISSS